MSLFGKTLFAGSRFVFWSLAPAILLSLIGFTCLLGKRDVVALLVLSALWVTGLSLILGMANPIRFGWAFRVFSTMIFLTYVCYLVSEVREKGWRLNWYHSRGDADTLNALIGMLTIGAPALVYAVFGRFNLRKRRPSTLMDRDFSPEFD